MNNLIFDMDGTLLDSMSYWKQLAREYAAKQNVDIPKDFDERTYNMDLNECGKYFVDELGVKKSAEQMKKEVLELIYKHYENDMPMKKGMKELLLAEKEKGSRMCIFTTSDRACAAAAMKRLGVLDCFEKILTVYDIGINKKDPNSYKKICEIMNFDTDNTMVYEDVIHAVRSAKAANCKVTAVYDEDSAAHWSEIEKIADRTIVF